LNRDLSSSFDSLSQHETSGGKLGLDASGNHVGAAVQVDVSCSGVGLASDLGEGVQEHVVDEHFIGTGRDLDGNHEVSGRQQSLGESIEGFQSPVGGAIPVVNENVSGIELDFQAHVLQDVTNGLAQGEEHTASLGDDVADEVNRGTRWKSGSGKTGDELSSLPLAVGHGERHREEQCKANLHGLVGPVRYKATEDRRNKATLLLTVPGLW
jgi:hypothetical protein